MQRRSRIIWVKFEIMVSYLDLILLIPIGWALWRGWRNGFVMEVFSMLSLFVGIYAGIHLSNWLAAFLRTRMGMTSENLPITCFIIILILVMVGLYFLGKLITQTVSAGGAERWNQIGGVFFSLTKTLLFLSMLFIFFNMADARFGILPEQQKEKSYFYKPIYNFALFILPSMEESSFYKKLEQEKMAPIMVSSNTKSEADSSNKK